MNNKYYQVTNPRYTRKKKCRQYKKELTNRKTTYYKFTMYGKYTVL